MKRSMYVAAISLVLGMPTYARAAARISAPPEGSISPYVWVGAGAVVFVAGLIVLFGIWQGYEPPRERHAGTPAEGPPDSLPPALAGALAGRGRPSLEHAVATLLLLADRGVLRVEESDRKTLGTRTYHLMRNVDQAGLAPHEQAVVDAAYGGDRPSSVTLAAARKRLFRHFRSIARAMKTDLDAAGLIDQHREATRRAYLRVMLTEFVLALAAFAAWPLLRAAHGFWPVTLFIGLAASGLVALLAYAMTTPLTDEGVERGRRWRTYRTELKKLVRQRGGRLPDISLAYPVALGLAHDWSKALKQHPIHAPAWFYSTEGQSAFPLFIAAAGVGAHGNSPPHHAH